MKTPYVEIFTITLYTILSKNATRKLKKDNEICKIKVIYVNVSDFFE